MKVVQKTSIITVFMLAYFLLPVNTLLGKDLAMNIQIPEVIQIEKTLNKTAVIFPEDSLLNDFVEILDSNLIENIMFDQEKMETFSICPMLYINSFPLDKTRVEIKIQTQDRVEERKDQDNFIVK